MHNTFSDKSFSFETTRKCEKIHTKIFHLKEVAELVTRPLLRRRPPPHHHRRQGQSQCGAPVLHLQILEE